MSSRKTFAALDGVRGIAAVAVMLFHTGRWPEIGRLFPSAYLAVDLFFALSGFVVAHAYAERLSADMSIGQFVRARIVRLWPLFLAGTLLGCVALLADHARRGYGVDLVAAAKSFALQASFLPDLSTRLTDGRMFPMNGPAWSLFFELFINICFALLIARLDLKRLLFLLPVLAIGLWLTAEHFNGLDAGHKWANASGGFIRVAFSFGAGLLLHQLWSRDLLPNLRGRRRWAAGLGSAAGLLGLMWFAPYREYRPLYDWSVIVFAWPALMVVWVGLEPVGAVRRACGALGRISYPAYVLHGPVFAICLTVAAEMGLLVRPMPPVFWLGSITLAVLVSWLATRFYDEPARAWLNARLSRWSRRRSLAAAA